MRLFVFSLLLAVAVVLSAVFLFDGGAGLQQHLVMVLSTTIGGVVVLGFALALLESRRDRLRQQKRQSYLQSPARNLRAVSAPAMGPASATKPSIALSAQPVAVKPAAPAPQVAAEPAAEPVEEVAQSTEEVVEERVAAKATPGNGISTQSATAFQSVAEDVASSATSEATDDVIAVSHETSEMERDPADQVLYLARDFEFEEVKRVLDLWQLAFDENVTGEILGRWTGEDGTMLEVLSGENGTPYIEIRGPMAKELAEFLPKDLPIYPGEPQGSELV